MTSCRRARFTSSGSHTIMRRRSPFSCCSWGARQCALRRSPRHQHEDPSHGRMTTRPRLLILIVAYNAEKSIDAVLARVPHQLAEEYDVDVLVLDDSSQDRTFEKSREVQRGRAIPFALHVLFNPVNQGYGGNQKSGHHCAIE